MTAPTRIMLVDDHAMVRQALAASLRGAGVVVEAEAGDAGSAMEMALRLKPDIVLMDIDMPWMICFDAARTMLAALPQTRLVMLSAFSHDHYISQALSVRARGYVTKRAGVAEVLEAVRAVAAGGTYFSPEVEARLILGDDGVRLDGADATRASTLTARELEVLRYIARGLAKKEIARTMYLSVKTIENYTARLMDKLDIHDRVELTRYAIREGLAEA